ncbi:hypothetical protein CapIbe_008451 [Capra ibex]
MELNWFLATLHLYQSSLFDTLGCLLICGGSCIELQESVPLFFSPELHALVKNLMGKKSEILPKMKFGNIFIKTFYSTVLL